MRKNENKRKKKREKNGKKRKKTKKTKNERILLTNINVLFFPRLFLLQI